MKFVVQEYLVKDEFFFSVDTHDNLDIRPDSPDYEEWERLKRHNRELKGRIEGEWAAAGLPTHRDLRALAEELARLEREEEKRKRLLVVDDEANVAFGLRALLQARGYDVELAHDGAEVMARLERDPLPDLLLLDLEMPVYDGQEVLRRMRQNDRLKDLPVLLATGSDIELSQLQRVSGFLRKPYPRQILCAMISRLLEKDESPSLGNQEE
jgi:CheY-like chemotaxis protein